MSDIMPRNTKTSKKVLDTGQNNHLNVSIEVEMTNAEQERNKSVQNLSTNDQDSILEMLSDKHLRGILVEIEYKQDELTNVDKLEAEMVERVYKLLSNLIE